MAGAVGGVSNTLELQSCEVYPVDVKGSLRSISAEDISAIAANIVGDVMFTLDIDMLKNVEIPGLTNKDIHGEESSVYADRYDPESRMMKWLLPQVVKLLEEAFSNPSQFLKEGVRINLFATDGTGLLDRDDIDAFLKQKVQESKKRIMNDWELGCLSFEIYLDFNRDQVCFTEDSTGIETDNLCFNRITNINGVVVGMTGGTVESCRKQLTTNVHW